MKKFTSLQIMLLMSFTLGSSQIYSRESDEMEMEDDNEAIVHELQAAQDEEEKMVVLADLVAFQPKSVERIIKDEADLEATFNSIRTFVNTKNTEIEKLNKEIDTLSNEKIVNEAERTRLEADVARLAVELADAQATFEKTIAKQRAKHKRDHRHEQAIKDLLKKAEQGLKTASKKTANFFNQTGITKAANQAGRYISNTVNQAGKSINKTFAKKKPKSKKNNEVVVQHGVTA